MQNNMKRIYIYMYNNCRIPENNTKFQINFISILKEYKRKVCVFTYYNDKLMLLLVQHEFSQ